MSSMASDIEITVLPPPLFNYDADDLLGEWKQWFLKLQDYLVAYDRADSPDDEKIRVLLNHLGNEGKEIYESLEAKDNPGERITSFEELTDALTSYFDSAKNVLFERFKFFKMKRKSGQTVVAFVKDLTVAASYCEFTEEDFIIRDKLLEQLKDKALIERLLVEGGSLTLERAVKICQKWEGRKTQVNENKPPSSRDDPDSPKPSATNTSRRKRDSKPKKIAGYNDGLPVVAILGVVPKEEQMSASVNTNQTSDDDRDFWDDGDSRAYSDEEENKPAKGPQSSMCDICGRICKGPAALRYHLQVHNDEKPYACKKCNYRGTLLASLQSHMRVHGKCTFKCDQCDFKARRSYGLKMHKRINHTGERPFACEHCDKRFPDRGALNYHVKSRHTGGPPPPRPDRIHWNYTCETCGRKFIMEDRYKKHLAGHNGEPYQCYSCDFKTISRNSIIRHLNNRHGEKRYCCSQCDYRTAMKSDYTDHLQKHSSERTFMCDICGFSATHRSTLGSHKRVHKERHISCDFCDYKTCRRASMNSHMRRHTGERPFECSFCGYKAAQRGTLNKHIEVIHNKESSRKSKAASQTASKAGSQTISKEAPQTAISKAAPQITSKPDSGQSVVSCQNNSDEGYVPNNPNIATNFNLNHLQPQSYNHPHVLPPPAPVYLPQNNFYPNAAYYNNNTNVEMVHNNSPFDLDQFVRSNMIN